MTEPGLSDTPVLTWVEGNIGRLRLNRPKALHALTTEMCRLMTQALLGWREDPAVRAVILDHSGERGFCAGGDIRMIAESGAVDCEAAREFFLTEYRLNHLLFTYPKPIVAFVDGIVMGGGVGISMPARFRVATERTLFAMPETGIGLFPDVGGGWYLPRLPGRSGYWLALTGARLRAADCTALGIATHFVPAERLEGLKAEFVAAPDDLPTLIEDAARHPGPAPLAEHREALDRLFAAETVEGVFANLEADGSDWARAQLQVLHSKSPQALKVTMRQLRTGERLGSFAENMAMEYRLATRVCRLHDFQEGVRAVIVDKDNTPRWDPPTLEGVSEAMLAEIFAPMAPGLEWTPLP